MQCIYCLRCDCFNVAKHSYVWHSLNSTSAWLWYISNNIMTHAIVFYKTTMSNLTPQCLIIIFKSWKLLALHHQVRFYFILTRGLLGAALTTVLCLIHGNIKPIYSTSKYHLSSTAKINITCKTACVTVRSSESSNKVKYSIMD